MAGWIPFLTISFDEGANLVLARPGRFQNHSDELRRIETRVESFSDTCAKVIGHLMPVPEPPRWDSHRLPKLVPQPAQEAIPTTSP